MPLSWESQENPVNFQRAQGISAQAKCLCVISQMAHKSLHVSRGLLAAWVRLEEAQMILAAQREGGSREHLLQHLPFLSLCSP